MFLWDQASNRPACVILKAILGGDRLVVPAKNRINRLPQLPRTIDS